MVRVVLIRHGESLWNKENKFTGWTDVPLTNKGEQEAKEAGESLKEKKMNFDVAYTSLLKRAVHTLNIILDEMDMCWLPVKKSWRLNERHYGKLQGLDKKKVAKEFGEDQVNLWRRSYHVQPPALEVSDERYPGNQMPYKMLGVPNLPLTESLQDTVSRFLPFFREEVEPNIHKGKNILIVAHGNSLRALMKYFETMSDDEICELNIPTGIPLVYELDDDLSILKKYYLGDDETVKKAQDQVKNQSK
ncbi:2,3-diphosphoglycerate-dependent phosphoglycerate mutase [Aureibacter tunicatorum]|uniref:2,3-bisphosphoglycerate-dependent phosphoglycerate mutase n=1 Tax=Aureibacter tunicatorum TaxID=866807 RepID=A0AAE3XNS1_9BACT|nr:2,3-diphosphoglycerate-dependent phosphoglycerate mutase [Aureibacter tunicatorum]MDR6239265.1 2,3-bisphosphoglycerate-dependent phosphoglycerate mutase [Aureibacter tunicatorum]BDD04810.1 2,3-bisphosphoglycerate-dependent phosphoglycerate mutase [Aureibacter tunicatorum]